jgi:tRNA-dihydrouridine synthase B
MTMKIGSIEFDSYPVFAAPMEDVSEPSFRYMCKKHGADLLYSEFVSSDAIVRQVKKTMRKLVRQYRFLLPSKLA